MTTIRTLAITLLASLSLAACSKPATPPADASATAAAPAGERGFLGEKMDQAFAEARRKLREGNISLNHGPNININGHNVRTGTGTADTPSAEITPRGDLLIDGKPADITPAQREQLLAYREQIIVVAEAGLAIGSRGVDLAGKALGGIPELLLGGEKAQKEYEARMQAEGKRIEEEARKLCNLLPPMLDSQQQLAAGLPAFKPYATMTRSDIDDCLKDATDPKDQGAAVMSD